MHNILPLSYYLQDDVTEIARDLLGKLLCTKIDGALTIGRIVETEAYCGATDRACHAYPDKRTSRTEIMYAKGGVAYVYFVYGMHHLFNIVTNKEGMADAVLIRAIEPVTGLEVMQERRQIKVNNKLLTGGPARLTQALGITVDHNAARLQGNTIWVAGSSLKKQESIGISTRIGVDYAGDDALLPWRFYIKGNKYVSK